MNLCYLIVLHSHILLLLISLYVSQNCSSFNSVIQRYDNRMYFARQASSSQGCFMRPSSSEQVLIVEFMAVLDVVHSIFLKLTICYICQSPCKASEAPLSARPFLPLKCSGLTNDGSCNTSEAPLFARPARTELNNANLSQIKHQVQDCKLFTPDMSKFSKQDRRIGPKEQFRLKKNTYFSESNGKLMVLQQVIF